MKYFSVLFLCILLGYPSLSMGEKSNIEQNEKYSFIAEENNRLLRDNVELNQIYNHSDVIKSIIKSSQFDLLDYPTIISDLQGKTALFGVG